MASNTRSSETNIFIIGGSGSGKTNTLNSIKHQSDIDKIYQYTKDICESKYQLLSKKRVQKDIQNLKGSKAFLEFFNDIKNIYLNIGYYKPKGKKHKILVLLDDMIVDIIRSNKKI